jgi:hypothetical protein
MGLIAKEHAVCLDFCQGLVHQYIQRLQPKSGGGKVLLLFIDGGAMSSDMSIVEVLFDKEGKHTVTSLAFRGSPAAGESMTHKLKELVEASVRKPSGVSEENWQHKIVRAAEELKVKTLGDNNESNMHCLAMKVWSNPGDTEAEVRVMRNIETTVGDRALGD